MTLIDSGEALWCLQQDLNREVLMLLINADVFALVALKYIIVAVKISVCAFVSCQCTQKVSLLKISCTIEHF